MATARSLLLGLSIADSTHKQLSNVLWVCCLTSIRRRTKWGRRFFNCDRAKLWFNDYLDRTLGHPARQLQPGWTGSFSPTPWPSTAHSCDCSSCHEGNGNCLYRLPALWTRGRATTSSGLGCLGSNPFEHLQRPRFYLLRDLGAIKAAAHAGNKGIR